MSTTIPSERPARSLLASALAALLALPSPAVAGEPSPAVAGEPSPAPSTPSAPADPLEALRGRFRAGMDKYKAGAFADAIVIWESIYFELGPDTGYRLAFDLARAYDQLGDGLRAAEHYDTYLEKVRARRHLGEQLEPNVAKQEETARERRDAIAAAKGRVEVRAGARGAAVVRVDNARPRVAPFLVYVEPGPHAVTIEAGGEIDAQRVTVGQGEIVVITPREAVAQEGPAPAPMVPLETRLERPFSPAVLWIGGGVALASVALPVLAYADAYSIKSEYDAGTASAGDRRRLASDYESARSNAYASVVVPAVLATAVGALSLYYLLGAKERRVPSARPAAALPVQLFSMPYLRR
jgi:hypothetical protein